MRCLPQRRRERRGTRRKSGPAINVVNDAAVIVSNEKCVFSKTKHIRRTAIDLSRFKKPGNEIGHRTAGLRNSYNTITPPQALFRRSMQRHEKGSGQIAGVEVLQSKRRAMSRKRSERGRHLATVKFFASRIKFRIGIDLRANLKTVRPAVVFAVLNCNKRVRRTIVAKVIRSHVCCVQAAADPTKSHSVAQATRVVMLV